MVIDQCDKDDKETNVMAYLIPDIIVMNLSDKGRQGEEIKKKMEFNDDVRITQMWKVNITGGGTHVHTTQIVP